MSQHTNRDDIQRNNKPTHGLSMVGGLEEAKQKSTHSFGANKMNAQGKPIEKTFIGRYVQLLISSATAFDAVMRFIVDDPRKPSMAESQAEITMVEMSFFGVLSLGPMFWSVWPFWFSCVLFGLFVVLNTVRYAILYDDLKPQPPYVKNK